MNLHIEQDYAYVGKDYWDWKAWIAGDKDDLDAVKSVRWMLHPSFSPSVVVSKDRSSSFRLETSGWGTFQLRAELLINDGSSVSLRHELVLEYPDDDSLEPAQVHSAVSKDSLRQSDPPKGAPWRAEAGEHLIRKVFLSFASADRSGAAVLKQGLEARGIKVNDDSGIKPGMPLDLVTAEVLANADATIVYLASNVPSPFVARDISESLNAGKPTIVLTEGELGPIEGLSDTVAVKLLDQTDPQGIQAALNDLGVPKLV